MYRFKIIKEITELEFFKGKQYIARNKKVEFKNLLLVDVQNIINKNLPLNIDKYLAIEDKKRIDNKTKTHYKPIVNNNRLNIQDVYLIQYYQKLIQKTYRITYPDRNTILSELLNIIPDIQNLHKYIIYKFDFESFFYNISLNKITCEIENSNILRPSEIKFLKNYINGYKKYENPSSLNLPRHCLRPGIGLNNALIEMLGKKFDYLLRSKLADKGLIYYARYVDDGILIFQEDLDESEIKPIIQQTMKDCFGKQTRLNDEKSTMIYKDKFDYLGYHFDLRQNSFKFGIAESKLEKYEKQIKNIILEYKNTKKLDLLLLKLDVFYKRTVFYSSGNTNYYTRWRVRGISDSYREIKRFLCKKDVQTVITKRTLDLFGATIKKNFTQEDIDMPNELEIQIKGDKFINNFKKNKAVLLDKHIGYSYDTLKKKVKVLCGDNEQVNLDFKGVDEQIRYYSSLSNDEIISDRFKVLNITRRKNKKLDELSYQELSNQLLKMVYELGKE